MFQTKIYVDLFRLSGKESNSTVLTHYTQVTILNSMYLFHL